MTQAVAAMRATDVHDARALELASTARSVPEARHAVAEDLRSAGVPQPVLDNVLAVVTELISNAVLHAKPLRLGKSRQGVLLRWAVAGRHVLVDVTDGGGAEPPTLKQTAVAEPDGRGLAIVDALARDWSVRTSDDGVTVQAVIGPSGGETAH